MSYYIQKYALLCTVGHRDRLIDKDIPLHIMAFLIIDVFVRHVAIYDIPDRFSRWWARSSKRPINITNSNQYIFLQVQLWFNSFENKMNSLTIN